MLCLGYHNFFFFFFSYGETRLYDAQGLHLLSKSCKCHLGGIYHFGVDKAMRMTKFQSQVLDPAYPDALGQCFVTVFRRLVNNCFIRNNK